jgi:hypothetical protein
MDIDLKVEPRKLARTLALVILALDAAYVFTQFFVRVLGWSSRTVLFALFDLNREMNIPTAYSGAALLLCAVLLAMTAAGERGRGRPFAGWAGMSGVFAFLALDEVLVLHERLNDPLRAALQTSGGLFHYAWVIPYAVLAAVFAAVYLPFLLRLPAGTRRLFVLSGIVFVGGAVGCELAGNLIIKDAPPLSVAMGVEILIEETMEMGGVVLFLYALASYIKTELPGLSLRLRVI